jgi:hypothetical protein
MGTFAKKIKKKDGNGMHQTQKPHAAQWDAAPGAWTQ